MIEVESEAGTPSKGDKTSLSEAPDVSCTQRTRPQEGGWAPDPREADGAGPIAKV